MGILLGFLLFAALFVAFAVAVIRSGAAAVRAAAEQTPADGTRVSALRLVVERNAAVGAADAMLKPLVTLDPTFSPASFLTWVQAAFARVAAFDGALPAAQYPVTGAMAQRLTQEAATWAGSGFAPVIREVRVDTAAIEAVRIDPQQQAVDVRLGGVWTHYIGSAGTVFEGSAQPVPFAQRATFVRPAGATSSAGPDASGAAAVTRCPHCGADVTNGTPVCAYCGTQVDQSKTPWLMDALVDVPKGAVAPQVAQAKPSTSLGLLLTASQSGDRSPTTLAFGKNLAAAVERIQAHDPAFSLARFMSFATQTYMRERRQQEPITVRKSDLFGVIANDQTEHIIVLVSSLGTGGKRLVEGAVFSRPAGSVTPPAPTAASDALCSECGAPLTAGDTACRYCSAPIPDVQGAWKLDRISASAQITTEGL